MTGKEREDIVAELSAIGTAIDDFLVCGRKASRKGMTETLPGVWISEDSAGLADALPWASLGTGDSARG